MPRRFLSLFIGLSALLIMAAGGSVAAAAGPGLHGRVLGLDEEGRYVGMVDDATIVFESEAGGIAAQATTGDNGYYRVDLPAGIYTYKISAAGYRTDDDGRGLEIQQSEGYVVHDFSMVQGESEESDEPDGSDAAPVGLLDGRVYEINERGERIGAVPWARIRLRRDDVIGLRRVVSRGGDPQGKESGRYAVELPAGEWRASVAAEGFESRVFADVISVAADQTTTRDFELRRQVPIVPTRQGIQGFVLLPGDAPRARIRIRIEPLLRPLAAIPSLVPDKVGQFVQDLPAGSYRVLAEAEGYHPARRVPVTVFEGRYTTVVLRLSPLASPGGPEETQPLKLAVTVQERTSKGLAPIAGARVLLRREGDALSQAARGDTDARGKISLDVAHAGNYALLVQAKDFKAAGQKLHIGPGQPNRADVILLRATPDLEDQLVTVNGSVAFRDPKNPKELHALPRTRLVWRDAPQSQPVQIVDSDAQGTFSVQLPAGKYVVELQPPAGFGGDKAEVAVAAKMPARTFILEPRGEPDGKPPVEPPRDVQVAGVVVGSPQLRAGNAVSIPDASLTWKGPQAEKSTRSDRSGRFSLVLPPGLYNVRVRADGYSDLDEAVVVQPGMGNVRLALARTAEPGPGPVEPLALNVRVLQRKGAAIPLRGGQGGPGGAGPLADAEVSILQQGRQVSAGRSDRAGRYTVQLKPGTYDIRVTSEGFVPGQSQVALTTMSESREIILTRAAAPDNPPQPPAGKHTLTFRIVEQAAPRPAPGGKTPPQAQPVPDDATPPPQKPGDGKRNSKGPSRGGLRLPQGGGASPLEQLQQRSQRDMERQGGGGEMLRPAVAPVSGATIVIRQGETVVAQGTTDKNGVYRVQLDAGMYDAKVSAAGYASTSQSVRMGDADVTRQVVLSKGATR